ncbi:hydrophobic surface binding protein A-domain-containing protein [Leptodontidium sp. MPI-SDFR-AT-0119]|nr:hydrophobic surface binding protein A-domain-containing protein [Leptodontidium sp. MPI-SDFR-AT-0119]
MVAIKNILFFITAASALTVGKRDAATILNDISTIDSNSKLEDSIKQGTTDAKASSQQSSADSKSVIAAIDKLIPDIEASLAAAEKKKAQFAADNLTGTVQKDLATLKSETDDFANALIAIASADTKAQGTAQKTKIDNDFNAAIAYFA